MSGMEMTWSTQMSFDGHHGCLNKSSLVKRRRIGY